MKNIQIVILILFMNCCTAQNIIPMNNYSTRDLKNNNYIKDTNGLLNKFVGIWKYTNGNDEFIVKITKKNQDNSNGLNDYYIDNLYGGYKYIKNGNILIDKLNYITNDLNNSQNFAEIQGNKLYDDYNSVSLVGFDSIIGKKLDVNLEIVPNSNPVKMHWKITARESININNTLPKQGAGFGIPTDVILTKQ